MLSFERQHAFLLGLKQKIEAYFLEKYLNYIIFHHDINMARCEKKKAEHYVSYQSFLERKLDPIWIEQRWGHNNWLRPGEGFDLLDWSSTKHPILLRTLLGIPVSFIRGIEKSKWDIGRIRAPCNILALTATSQVMIYLCEHSPEYFVVFTSNTESLKPQALAGEELGILESAAWIYMCSTINIGFEFLQYR